MSEYNKELRDRIEENLRMFDYPSFDGDDIFCVLGEIDRLNAKIAELDAALAYLRSLLAGKEQTVNELHIEIIQLQSRNSRLLSAITEISELTQEFTYDSTTQEFSYDRTMLQIKKIVDKITGEVKEDN